MFESMSPNQFSNSSDMRYSRSRNMIQIENIAYPKIIRNPKPIKIADKTSPDVSKESALLHKHVTRVMSK